MYRPDASSRNSPSDRRADLLDRRRGRRGGRRLTDRRPDVVHGLLCPTCDIGILTLMDAQFGEQALHLTYRCASCGERRVLTTDRYEAIRDHLYWQAHEQVRAPNDADSHM